MTADDSLVTVLLPVLREHLDAEPERYDPDVHEVHGAASRERAWDEWDRTRGAYVAIISARLLRAWADDNGVDLWGRR